MQLNYFFFQTLYKEKDKVISLNLSNELVWNRTNQLGCVIFSADDVSGSGPDGLSLQTYGLDTGGLGFFLLDLVSLDTVKEILSALGGLNVLNADGDTLGENPSPDTLVDDNTECTLGNVEDTSSLSVVGLVGHTLLEGTATYKYYD